MCSEPRRALAGISTFAASAIAALSAACNGTTSYLDATGTAGRQEATLGRWLTITASVVVMLVCVVLLAAIWRHRGERATPRDTDGRGADMQRREIHSG